MDGGAESPSHQSRLVVHPEFFQGAKTARRYGKTLERQSHFREKAKSFGGHYDRPPRCRALIPSRIHPRCYQGEYA